MTHKKTTRTSASDVSTTCIVLSPGKHDVEEKFAYISDKSKLITFFPLIMEDIRITFDNSSYSPGQNVTGKVIIRSDHSLNLLSLRICIHGEETTFWKKFKNSRKCDNDSDCKIYKSHQHFLDAFTQPWSCLVGSNKLPPGENVFPFFFPLPSNCPPSFEGKYGWIRYSIHAELDRPWRFNGEAKKQFSVTPVVDLQTIPKAIKSAIGLACKHSGFLGMKEVKMKVWLRKSGYIPGEIIPIVINIENHAKKHCFSATAKLIQHMHYSAQQEHSHLFSDQHCHKHCDHKTGQVTVAETYKTVRAECCTTHLDVNMSITVPRVTVPSFKTSLIEVDYVVLVSLEEKLECEMPLIIGTVPIQHGTTVIPQVTVAPVGLAEPPPDYRNSVVPSAPQITNC